MDALRILNALEGRAQRRKERREFFKVAGGFAAGAAGTMALSACGGTHSTTAATAATTSSGPSDVDILNFALQLEYLESNFYSYAAYGTPIAASMTSGVGTVGAVTGGTKANLSSPLVIAYANEIAQDEINHVNFLRSALTTSAVAQPAIDVSAAGAFTTAAMAAGLIQQGQTFDPYSSDEAFLLGAYIFEDVGVTAYHGAAPLITSKTYLDAAAGILAVEAYHAGLIRTALYAMGLQTPAPAIDPYVATAAISKLRATLDGTESGTPDDQGIAPAGVTDANVATNTMSNIVPTDANSLAFDRTTAQVLNVVFGTAGAGVTKGLFFPTGLNGNITST